MFGTILISVVTAMHLYVFLHIGSLLGGRYEVDGMTIIVCRGTGTWGPRMRLWRPGEILRVTLRSGGRQETVEENAPEDR